MYTVLFEHSLVSVHLYNWNQALHSACADRDQVAAAKAALLIELQELRQQQRDGQELKATLAQREAVLIAWTAADDSALEMKTADLGRMQAAVDVRKDILATQEAQESQGTASQIWLNSSALHLHSSCAQIATGVVSENTCDSRVVLDTLSAEADRP